MKNIPDDILVKVYKKCTIDSRIKLLKVRFIPTRIKIKNIEERFNQISYLTSKYADAIPTDIFEKDYFHPYSIDKYTTLSTREDDNFDRKLIEVWQYLDDGFGDIDYFKDQEKEGNNQGIKNCFFLDKHKDIPLDFDLDNTKKIINCVRFNLNAEDDYDRAVMPKNMKKIRFYEKVTFRYAVETVEMYLSKVITPAYWNQMGDGYDIKYIGTHSRGRLLPWGCSDLKNYKLDSNGTLHLYFLGEREDTYKRLSFIQ
jgi:hypothetical protein